MKEVNIQVDKAYTHDQGYARVRMDPATMKTLDLQPGDLVKIMGKNTTINKVWMAQKEDWNKNIIRLDKFSRANAKVNIDDTVTVQTLDKIVPADSLILVPTSHIPEIEGTERFFDLNGLINFPVSQDDILVVRSIFPIPGNNPKLKFSLNFKVKSLSPPHACIISESTNIKFGTDSLCEDTTGISYEDIGGLKSELLQVREMIDLPIRHPELFQTLGIEAPKGILMYGPPGTGKTLIAKAVAHETKAHFYTIAGPEIFSKFYGESEEKLREIFEDAEKNAPSIIFIDELDSIAPRREEVTGEVERRIVAQLLTMLDGIEKRGQVIVIGATNRPDAIDPGLRRPGRFDREIEIGVPSETDRIEILKIHTRNMPLEGSVKLHASKKITAQSQKRYADKCTKMLTELGKITRGYTGADLASLTREAGIIALHRQISHEDLDTDTIPDEILRSLEVTSADFISAMQKITPSAMREIAIETGDVRWNDIGGYSRIVHEVQESVTLPITSKEKFTALGIRPPKGVLLYGPPGTGKTLIAKAAATESGANFIAIKGPELLSKWVGDSEKSVRDIFKKARQTAPSIIFFDEIDALTANRTSSASTEVLASVLNQILSEMDGIEELNNVLILAASNRPDLIDPALLRNGRFDRLIYIGEPTAAERKEILTVQTKSVPLDVSNKSSFLNTLAAKTEGFTGADLQGLVQRSAMTALRKGRTTVTESDFTESLSSIHPTITPKVREFYETLYNSFKQSRPTELLNLPEYQ